MQIYIKPYGKKSDTLLFSTNGFRHSLIYLNEVLGIDYRFSISFNNRDKYTNEKISTTEILYSIAKSIAHRIPFEHKYADINDPEISEWIDMLTVIPDISREIAITIVSCYPSFSSLMEIYMSNDLEETEKLNLLTDIAVYFAKNSEFSVEIIGLKKSSTIYKYLMSK